MIQNFVPLGSELMFRIIYPNKEHLHYFGAKTYDKSIFQGIFFEGGWGGGELVGVEMLW